MFKVIEYVVRWKKLPGKAETVAKPTNKKVIREFETLEAARKFSEGRKKSVIEYPRKFIREMQA